MPQFLTVLLNNWDRIIAVVAMAAMAWLSLHQAAIIGEDKGKIAQAQKTATEMAQAFNDYKEKQDRVINEMTALNYENEQRSDRSKTRAREILNVPKNQDGAIAPVLRDFPKRLRDAEQRH